MNYNFYLFNVFQLIFLVFYLIYYGNIKPYIPFLQAFLSGIFGGLIILLFAPLLVEAVSIENTFFDVLFKAALLEKTISFIMIFTLVHSFEREKRLISILTAGIQFAAGFAFLENVIYILRFEPQILYLRLLSSVPMHLSTCGIQAYFIGLYHFYSHRRNKYLNLVYSMIFPVFLHALYDYLTVSTNHKHYTYIGSVIVLSVFIFEVLYSKILTYPARDDLEQENLKLEYWETLQNQKGHLKWILYSSGTRNLPRISFFRFEKDYVKLFIAFSILVFPLLFTIKPELFFLYFKVHKEVQFTLFVIMPVSFFFMFLILGSVNPEYFKNKKISIPIVLDVDVVLQNGKRTTGISYELFPFSTFIHFDDEVNENEKVTLKFSYGYHTSMPVTAEVKKYIPNFHKEYPSGIIVEIEENKKEFQKFYYRYLIQRTLKGLVFLFHLPGSERIRALFVRPLTVMQNERFYKKGEIIFREGDTGKHFYLIKKGKVAFYKEQSGNKRRKISELKAGEIFGEMALISKTPRSATAICEEDCILAVAHIDHLEALIQANPEFVMKLIQNLIRIIHKKEAQLENFRVFNELYIKTLQDIEESQV